MPPMSEFEAYLIVQIREMHERIDAKCEEAIQGGKHGVKAVYSALGIISLEIDPEVPYGEIHYYYKGF